MSNQKWNATQYIDGAAFVAEHGEPVFALLNPRPGEQILDLGCGDGTLSVKLSEAGAIVHCVDASDSMVAAAIGRGLDAEVCSGEQLAYENRFDAVFSNAALHWMTDYRAVINGVYRALKPGGRFVAEMGGEGNITALVEAMCTVFARHAEFGQFRNPWFFPALADYRDALEDGGFKVHSIERFERPTPLQSGVRGWLQLFARGITGLLDDAQKTCFLDEVEALLRPSLYSERNGWVADYVRLRFEAYKL